MAAQVTNYQCPSCTGPLQFDSKTGKLTCEYCGSAFSPEEIEAFYREKDEAAVQAAAQEQEGGKEQAPPGSGSWDLAGAGGEWGEDAADVRVYHCPSCGAELLCSQTTAATACPYCNNPTIIPGQLGGTLKPDYVIPFKLEKKQAIAALKKHYLKRPFLPRAFKTANHLEEIKGLYVPFWLFDADALAELQFDATRSTTHRDGDYRVTVTSHYNVTRSGRVRFEQIPTDASKKMPDDLMDSLEPFDYTGLVPFSTAYLPGFLADRYDVTVAEDAVRADERCKNTVEELLKADVTGFATVTTTSRNIDLARGKVHYALLPVWILKTSWENKDFLFAMNGQTGKFVGDLPVSKGRFWGLCAALTAVLSTLAYLILH